jgi:hypothetical protein
MDLFAIDDSAHSKPTRDGMGPLVAVGGVHVPGDQVRELEHGLDELCADYDFPAGEEFKWSPHRKSWMHKSLVGADRTDFFMDALRLAHGAHAVAVVVMADTTKNMAAKASQTHEEDVTQLFLERAHNQIPDGGHALVTSTARAATPRATLTSSRPASTRCGPARPTRRSIDSRSHCRRTRGSHAWFSSRT